MKATAAAKKKDKKDEEVKPTITKWEEAKREVERQNITNQTIVGTKEGIIKILKRLVGGNILDTVTKQRMQAETRALTTTHSTTSSS